MVWYGVVWCGVVWCDVMWCDVMYVMWCDVMWYDMIWYDMLWYDMIWYDMIWYMNDMIWYDTIRYDMIWCDMLWYDTWYTNSNYQLVKYFFAIVKVKLVHLSKSKHQANIKENQVTVLARLCNRVVCSSKSRRCKNHNRYENLEWGVHIFSWCWRYNLAPHAKLMVADYGLPFTDDDASEMLCNTAI